MDLANVLGVKINVFKKKDEVIEKILEFFKDGQQHFIVTANPEIMLAARRDEEYYYIINKADLAIPDGSGLQIACAMAGSPTARIAGADLTTEILKIASRQGKKAAVLVWKRGLSSAEKIEKALRELWPGLPVMVKNIDRNKDIIYDDISRFKPEILFVAIGAPWQEKLIYHNLPKLPTVKLAIGVGGTFDFITGKIKRAPKIFRLLGMEWLWRLFVQPWRWQRIINATVFFPIFFVKQHFINKFFYRKNVVALIFNDQNQVLILNWSRDDVYWGLPQGGVEFWEDRRTAVRRELKEEIGTDKLEIMAEYKNIYSYKWPREFFHFGYKGQKQTLFIVKFLDEINNIKINYWEHKDWKWVPADELIKESHPVHEKAYTIFLEKFSHPTFSPPASARRGDDKIL